MATTLQQVEEFLNDFKVKMSIWNILFRDDRKKNMLTLSELELPPIERKKIIEKLVATDYSEGPLEETLYKGNDMWVFGRIVKNKEVYIKITMGIAGSGVICISFHIAEHPMSYPLKNQTT